MTTFAIFADVAVVVVVVVVVEHQTSIKNSIWLAVKLVVVAVD